MEDLNISIGNRINKLRNAHGLTQEKLSEELDVSIKHMSEVERGIKSFSLEKLIAASKRLDCTLDYLILGDEKEDGTGILPASVLELLSSNDTEEKELFLEYINLYLKIRK